MESRFYERGILRDPEASWTERVLALFFRREDIPERFGDQLYLRRFFVFPAIPVLGICERYLHVFYKSDSDPDCHDHPWAFKTRVLRGGYVDEAWKCEWDATKTNYVRTVINYGVMERWDTAYREATHTHRALLIDPEKRTWTLVARSPKVRDWFFHTKDGPVGHEEYLRGEP